MDVVSRIIRRIELDDPVYFGDVETSSGDVGAEEGSGWSVAEFEEGGGSFLLFLFSLRVGWERKGERVSW